MDDKDYLESLASSMDSSIEVLSMPRDPVEDEDLSSPWEQNTIDGVRDRGETTRKCFYKSGEQSGSGDGMVTAMSETRMESSTNYDFLADCGGEEREAVFDQSRDVSSTASNNFCQTGTDHQDIQHQQGPDADIWHNKVKDDSIADSLGEMKTAMKDVVVKVCQRARGYGTSVVAYRQAVFSMEHLVGLKNFLLGHWLVIAITSILLFYFIDTSARLHEMENLVKQYKSDNEILHEKMQVWTKAFGDPDLKKRSKFAVKLTSQSYSVDKCYKELKLDQITEMGIHSEFFDKSLNMYRYMVPKDGVYRFDAACQVDYGTYKLYLYVENDEMDAHNLGEITPHVGKLLPLKKGDRLFIMLTRTCIGSFEMQWCEFKGHLTSI